MKSGTHLVVPVYHADGHAVASTEKAAKKRDADVADADVSKSAKKAKDKAKEKTAKADEAAKDAEKSASKDAKEVQGRGGRRGRAVQVLGGEEQPAIDKDADGQPQIGRIAIEERADRRAGRAPPARNRNSAGRRVAASFRDSNQAATTASTSRFPRARRFGRPRAGPSVYSGDGLKGYGNLVLIKHPNGFVSAYGNNGELDVKRGEQVTRGQVIAKSGDTGNVNSPQLHFELRKGSTPVDPTSYLAGL